MLCFPLDSEAPAEQDDLGRFVCFFEERCHYIMQGSSCLSLPRAGITDIHHHTSGLSIFKVFDQ